MNKRSKFIAITMIAALSVSVLPAVTSVGTYAADATTTATTWTPPATTTPTAPKPTTTAPKPTTTAPKPTTTTTKPVVTTSGTVTATGIFRLLVQGSFGEDVKLLQTMLNKLSYKLSVDGIFGKLTAGAVRDFQGKNGLVVDGMVGPKTLAKLAPAAPAAPVVPTAPVSTVGPAVDTVATASIVNTAAAFEQAISKDGKWIITTLKDLTIDKDLVLEGTFINGKKDAAGNDIIQRKIGLYTQDANHNVIDRFTLTAPKLTVLSPNARIQNGTFKGNLYINAEKFQLVGSKVVGNVYFMTQAAKDTFTMDAKSSVSGEKVLVQLDAVTSPSIVDTLAALEKGISKDGKWITSVVRDLTTDKALLMDGDFVTGSLDAAGKPIVRRKLSLYSQDDKRNITRKFTLTAPKITITSPKAELSGGIFNGDVYISTSGVKLVKQAVNGNIYFTTQAAKDTFSMDALSAVNGQKILIDVDAVTTASLVDTATAFEQGISKDGKWLVAVSRDLVINKALVLEGDFKNGEVVDRKIALYTQDEKRNVTRSFTLTAQRLTIKSPSARLQYGTYDMNIYVEASNVRLQSTKIDGNVYVSAPNFSLTKSTVTGTIIFMNAEAKATFKTDDLSVITGGTATAIQ